MKLVDSNYIELVVMGSLLRPISWYRERFADFIYEMPRPHGEVLRLMQSCDVFVLPSIVEGRALVQQEAMACGLPVIATKNAGADDVISSENGHEVYASQESLREVAKALEAKFGEPRKAALTWKPQNTVTVDDETGEKLLKLMDLLNDHDDVQNVFANFEISDALVAKMGG